MPATLVSKAVEESTYVITASFTDEDGNAVEPEAGLTWSLYDKYGNVINEREDVTLTPATSVDIVLSGDDLALTSNDSGVRKLTVKGTYVSDLGTLPLKDEVTFVVADLVGIT